MPFSIWEGSIAALEGPPMEDGDSMREHEGAAREQRGRSKRSKGVQGMLSLIALDTLKACLINVVASVGAVGTCKKRAICLSPHPLT